MTERKTRIAISVTAAVLSLGLGGSGIAAWEIHATHPAATGEHHLLQVQDRGRTGSTFKSAPEFPPTGYLEEFDDAAQGRFDRAAPELSRDFPPAGGSRSSRPSPEFPEYAPEGLGSRVPFGQRQGSTEPRGTGSGTSQQMWGAPPPVAPPVLGQDWPMPPADAAGAWGEFPSMPPVGGSSDWGEYPGMPSEHRYSGWGDSPAEDPRRARPSPGLEPQWPRSPAPADSYPSYPEYQHDSWDRARPETPRDRFPSYRDSPRGGYDWGR